MFEAPLTFAEALAELNSRLDTPTALKYRQIIAAWDADMRARAFFSARVTEAGVLSELHSKVQAVLDGKMTDKQAVALLRDYFFGSGADPLARMGFAPPHRGPERIGARSIDELASLPRLELIIETNLRMAQECGHYQSWAESAAYWRYGIWRCGWAEEHREEHLAREGRVYAFDHPIWTQSPPGGEFNCHCYREIASEEDIRRLGLSPEPLHSPFTPSSLGFDPSRSLRQPPPFGKRVRPEYADSAQRKIDAFAREEDPTPPPPPVPTPTDEQDTNRFEGSGVTTIKIPAGKIMQGVQAAQSAIAEITASKVPPFNAIYRLMNDNEKTRYNKGTLGRHVVLLPHGRGGKKLHDIAIRPYCSYPGFVCMHEMVHAYIDEGIIRPKEVERIYEQLKLTRTFKENEKAIHKRYGDKRINEWVTRAITWSWMTQATNEFIQDERFAIMLKPSYGKHTIWESFGFSQKTNLAESQLEDKIMKLTPRTLLGKMKRKLGFSDSPPPAKSEEDEPFMFGFSKRQLREYCAREGITLEELLARIEQDKRERLAMKPEDRPIYMM